MTPFMAQKPWSVLAGVQGSPPTQQHRLALRASSVSTVKLDHKRWRLRCRGQLAGSLFSIFRTSHGLSPNSRIPKM